MSMKASHPTTAAPFNMAMLFYFELHDLRMYKSKVKIDNDIEAYFEAIEEICTHISFQLTKEENEEIDTHINKIRTRLRTRYKGASAARIRATMRLKVKDDLRQLDKLLNKRMHKYNMLFPKIEIVGGLEEIDKRYNVGNMKKNF